jgi:hypothetical protein
VVIQEVALAEEQEEEQILEEEQDLIPAVIQEVE